MRSIRRQWLVCDSVWQCKTAVLGQTGRWEYLGWPDTDNRELFHQRKTTTAQPEESEGQTGATIQKRNCLLKNTALIYHLHPRRIISAPHVHCAYIEMLLRDGVKNIFDQLDQMGGGRGDPFGQAERTKKRFSPSVSKMQENGSRRLAMVSPGKIQAVTFSSRSYAEAGRKNMKCCH